MGYGVSGSGPERDAPRGLDAEADRNDWKLVDEILANPGEGANRALTALMDRHGPKVYQVAKFITGHGEDAEDVYQDTFVTFLAKVRDGKLKRGKGSVGGFLSGVAEGIALNLRRTQGRRQGLLRRAAKDVVQTRSYEESELNATICSLFEDMPDDLRDVVKDHFEGWSEEQIAARQGVPLPKVKDRLKRGKGVLESRVKQLGLTASSVAIAQALASGAKAAPVPAHLASAVLERVASGAVQAKAAAWGTTGLLGSGVGKAVVATAVVLSAATASVVVLRPKPPVLKVAAPPPVVPNGVGMRMRLVPAGTFRMGSPGDGGTPSPMDLRAERPVHAVTVTRPFRISETEVTRGQFRTVMDRDPSSFRPDEGPVDNLPVENVSRNDAIRFCNALSRSEKLGEYYQIADEEPTDSVRILGGNGYRLPTEAEWEYACRAGSQGAYCFGGEATDGDARQLQEFAWFDANSEGRPLPVRGKTPNAWGLYDMHGNVFEWVQDVFSEDYYAKSPAEDPRGPELDPSAPAHVYRGGAFNSTPVFLRSACRMNVRGLFQAPVIGFRVARDAP